jgi:hypothetical protein
MTGEDGEALSFIRDCGSFMNRAEFQAAVRNQLREVPLATRRAWTETELFAWWMQTTEANPGLVWIGGRGDPWRYVKGMCKHLIGERTPSLQPPDEDCDL